MTSLLLPLLLFIGADEATQTVPIAERQPLVLLVQSPERAAASLPDLVKSAAPIFALHTSFDVVAPLDVRVDPGELEACRSSAIGCWYRQVAHANENASVLLLGFFAGAKETGEVQVEALYFDARTAPDVGKIFSDEELERVLVDRAPVVARKTLMRNDHTAIRKYFVELVETHLNPTLKTNGRLQSLGDIVLRLPQRALSIELDGKERTAHGPHVRLKGVEPGTRSLIIRDAGDKKQLYQGGIDVRAGADAFVEVTLPKSTLESALFWSGAGAATLGAVVTVLAVAKKTDPSINACDAQHCQDLDRQFVSFCGNGNDCSFFSATRIAPLGYSLILTGAIWMFGELFTEEELTWLPLVAGIAGGAAGYGVSVAID